MLKYAKGVDERDMVLYRGCFAHDAVVVFDGTTYASAEAWFAFVESALDGFGATQHMLGPSLIDIDGDTAHCRTDVQALHYLLNEPGTTLTLWGTYETGMRRVDGVWKIASHNVVVRGTRKQSG